jgi:hypothetical protein
MHPGSSNYWPLLICILKLSKQLSRSFIFCRGAPTVQSQPRQPHNPTWPCHHGWWKLRALHFIKTPVNVVSVTPNSTRSLPHSSSTEIEDEVGAGWQWTREQGAVNAKVGVRRCQQTLHWVSPGCTDCGAAAPCHADDDLKAKRHQSMISVPELYRYSEWYLLQSFWGRSRWSGRQQPIL